LAEEGVYFVTAVEVITFSRDRNTNIIINITTTVCCCFCWGGYIFGCWFCMSRDYSRS